MNLLLKQLQHQVRVSQVDICHVSLCQVLAYVIKMQSRLDAEYGSVIVDSEIVGDNVRQKYTNGYGKKSAAAPHCGFFSPQPADFFQIASSLLAQLQLHLPKTVILYIITCQLTIHDSLATRESITTINYNEISHSDRFLGKKIRSGPLSGFFPIL